MIQANIVAPSTTNLADRLAQGKALRHQTPRSAHAHWEPAKDRPNPIALLEKCNEGRLPELIPVRYGRMAASPFAYYRGSAAAMAFDLASTPMTGAPVQACGDCHLMNFGGFGTPERNFIFDLTDFDETLPGPWEWDVKRLAASVVMAARSISLSPADAKAAVLACLRSYRRRTARYAEMHSLDVWYARIDGKALLGFSHNAQCRRLRQQALEKIRSRNTDHLLHRLTEVVDGRLRFKDNPPLVFHLPRGDRFDEDLRRFVKRYRDSLQEDRRTLLSRYEVIDTAMKVVGVGSVGTRCAILLMSRGDEDALVLQYKEAGASVLEPYVGKSKHKDHAQRVVAGQRLLQSASDMFLGWSTDEQGRNFYFRQLRDMKTTVNVAEMTASDLIGYVEMCGWALARGHAKSGDPALISGYLGRSDVFDRAIAKFAQTYADQTELDFAEMVKAVKECRLVVYQEKPNGKAVSAKEEAASPASPRKGRPPSP
jgi:uncharacterized protein (DUF2252 family)